MNRNMKSDIKQPTMLGVSAQQTKSFIELLKINSNYITEIFLRTRLGEYQDYCDFVDKLKIITDEIIKDIDDMCNKEFNVPHFNIPHSKADQELNLHNNLTDLGIM